MANTTIDHDEIRTWAEERGGKPAGVDGTGTKGKIGMIRLMFPDNPESEHSGLSEISWDEFFQQFEENGLALIYEPDSMFNKIVARDADGHRKSKRS